MYGKYKVVQLNSPEELQEVLDNVNEICIMVYWRKKRPDEYFKQNCFIEESLSKYKITYRPGKNVIQYVFDRDGKYLIKAQPKNCVAGMSKVYKIQRTEDIGIKADKLPSASALLYKNPKYNGKGVLAYEYDLSDAYGQMLKLPIPDIRTIKYNSEVGEGEVGFCDIGGHMKMIDQPGIECDWVFKLMDSPYKNWVENIEKKIKKAKTSEEKTELKSKYRFSIGDLQNINPFWRAMIVERCNKLVMSYMDENTIYCNTDSIVSTVERLDIKMDAKFTWKEKRVKQLFKWQKDKLNYQWNLEVPTMRGAYKRYVEHYNKEHPDKPWDILVDDYPESLQTRFTIDKDTLQLIDIGE